ncbi:MAG: hypothetical protein KJZ74_08420 [Gemmatimonadales bacterium]|nr:hypothetical protein [Gemmatimonadota bacterium]MCL4213924.1 hypothetical protein [Gemmatimonadales bacterium]
MHVRRFLVPVSLLLAVSGSACYTLKPLTTTPTPGTNVEVQLSSAGTDAVTALVGPRAARISGTVRSATAEVIEVEISEVVTLDGQSYYLQGSTVSLAREHLALVRARQFDKGRTAIAVTAGVLSAGAIIAGVRFGGGGDGNGGGGGGTPAMVPPR